MIKAVGINDSMRFGAFKNVKNGHANNVNVIREQNNVVNVEEKSMLLSSFFQPQKTVSFKATICETMPEDWVQQLNGIVADGGVNEKYGYNCAYPMNETFPSARLLLDDSNEGKMFAFFETEVVKDPQFGGVFKRPKRSGYIFINGDGKYTKVSPDEVKNTLYSRSKSSVAESMVPIFNKQGHIEERNNLFEKNKFSSVENINMHIDYFIEEGRTEEALELYPDKAEQINQKEKEILKLNYSTRLEPEQLDTFKRALIDCDIEEILAVTEEPKWFETDVPVKFKYADRLPESVSKANVDQRNDLLKLFLKNSTFEEYSSIQKKEAKRESMLSALVTDYELDRIPLALFTLGISELSYYNQLWNDAQKNHEKMVKGISMASDLLHMIVETKQAHNEEQRKFAYGTIETEKKKEIIKTRIENILLYAIDAYGKNKEVFVPNCVMLKGPNSSINKDILLSIKDMTDANFVQVESQINKDDMQSDLFEQLEQAEENYEKTGKRTIIFVNGMDKLLNPKLNTKENIACMKDLMGSASEDYHSTILFYTKHPEKLDAGALASHRVEYKIDAPFDFITGGQVEN